MHEPDLREKTPKPPLGSRLHASWSDSALSSHTDEADHAFHMSDLAAAALADLDGFIDEEEEGEVEDAERC